MPRSLSPFGSTDVVIDDEFWTPRLRTNREVTLEHEYEQLRETGRIDNFRKAAGELDGEFEGIYYNDSDVYKWVEAASNVVATHDDPDLERRLDAVVSAIAAAQQDDGYLNTYFTLEREREERWTTLMKYHELYCAGHFIEAAIAHKRATGADTLLDVARRLADHIDDVFGPDGKTGYPGHEEIELALVELYRETDQRRYLDLATFFVDERGLPDSRFEWEFEHAEEVTGDPEVVRSHPNVENGEYDGHYAQDHAPVREQDTVEGHAVRATYLYCGMAGVARETGDEDLIETLETLWQNLTKRRMYVTGGIGSAAKNEGFTEDYDLPDRDAYAETCAAVGNIIWNQRMLELTGEGRFGDVIERTLYNGFLSGVSLSGEEFFYVNPLASHGDHHRKGWFSTACCPPNVARLLASLDQYVYLQEGTELFVDLYVSNTGETTVDGTRVELEQETDYPWDGTVRLDVSPAEPAEFAVNLRVPEWCDEASLSVNGDERDLNVRDGFARVSRTWNDGDSVTLTLAMPVEQVAVNPAVEASAGRVALRRGPLVYCLEETDNPRRPREIQLPADVSADVEARPDLLDGVSVVRGEGSAPESGDWDGDLYRSRGETDVEPVEFTAIPYYGWDHRDPGAMRVWLQTT